MAPATGFEPAYSPVTGEWDSLCPTQIDYIFFKENMLETLVRIPRIERGLLRLSVVRFNQLIYTRI